AGDRGTAAAERIRFRMAAAAGFPADARLAEFVSQYARAGGGSRACADLCAVGLRDGEVLRRDFSRPAARGQAQRRARRPRLRAAWLAVARGRLRAARRAAGPHHPPVGQRDDEVDWGHDQRQRGGIGLAVYHADRARTRELQPAYLPRRDCGGGVARVPARARFLSRARAPRGCLGLRLSAADFAHAGHGGGFRAADQADFRTVFPHRKACANAVRPRAVLPEPHRRPPVVLAICAGGARGGAAVGMDRRAATRAHPHLSYLQLCHIDPAAGVCAMIEAILSQLFQTLLAVLLAPLMLGWK